MKRHVLPMVMATAMTLSAVPAPALANESRPEAVSGIETPIEDGEETPAEPETEEPAAETIIIESKRMIPDADLPDNDELFAMYAENVLYDYDAAVFGTAARERLNDGQKAVYDALKGWIKDIAAGKQTKTEVTIGEAVSVQGVYCAVDIEVTFTGMLELEELQKVVDALMADMPYAITL